MASHGSNDGDEQEPKLDFSSDAFLSRREPVRELMHTFSTLYVDSEEENEGVASENEIEQQISDCSAPEPEKEKQEAPTQQQVQISGATLIEQLIERVTKLESRVEECVQQMHESVTFAECKAVEERVTYHLERECERVQKKMEFELQDLSKSMVDCLKRRDAQIDHKFKTLMPVMSTPKLPKSNLSAPASRAAVVNQTYHVPSSQLSCLEGMSMMSFHPPVKIEFPSFSNSEEEDPVTFIERCEEYVAIRPLNDCEILASLTSVLKGTAKDWWLAEKKNVQTWQRFKDIFLRSFLSEDYEEEAARRLLERKQGIKESIRDFAYHYRALCLRRNKDMSEREIVHAILRNCNPRLASLLRGTVRVVDDLVRFGTQIEKDFEESRRYWSQVNSETQQRRANVSREVVPRSSLANTRTMQSTKSVVQPEMITLPIILRGRYLKAMIDTGSTLSLIQESCWKQLQCQEPCKPSNGQSFLLANGQRQDAIGKLEWECELQGRKIDLTLYVMRDTDLTVPIILGMDFLLSSEIGLDFRRYQYHLPALEDDEKVETFSLLSQESGSTVHFYLALSTPVSSDETLQSIHDLIQKADMNHHSKEVLRELMLKWPTVCTNEIGQSSIIKHRIITNDEVPVRKRPYKLSREKQQFVDAEIQGLLDKKIIRPSISPYASPVVVVPKKDGGSRLCVDYRGLNAKTHLDAYPMPQIQDILESLHGTTVFSTLDLKTGYWQMEMEPESIQKTAFVTSAGLFEFLRLPFGLKNAAASFQRLMEHVLRDLRGKCCLIYIDDVVIFSENEEKHLQHLNQVFSCLSNAGLTLNLRKCNFFQKSLTFLGHVISGEGVKTDPSKVSAVCDFPVPQSLKDLQRFIGLAGWYHRFIPKFSEKAVSLHALKQKNATWVWTDECQTAFDTIKQDLTNAPVLIPPDLSKSFKVQTDASEFGLGAVLTQDLEGEEHVVAYASRLLRGPEKAYSVSEKECLAVIWAVEKWRTYLEGRPFEVITDHSALTWVFQHPKLSSRLTRWTIRLQGFQFTVKYRKGQSNVVPDVLSRSMEPVATSGRLTVVKAMKSPVKPAILPVNLSDLVTAQSEDSEVQELSKKADAQVDVDNTRVRYVCENGLLFRSVPSSHCGEKLQLVIPVSLRNEFLQYAHDNPLSGHLGRMKTLLRLMEVAYWPSMRADVWKYCKFCHICQKYKPNLSKLSGHLQSTPVVEPGYMLGVDLMGPFPKSGKQNEHLLVVVDYCSKWVELFPLRTAKAPQIARILVEEIFTRWGTPLTLYLIVEHSSHPILLT